MSTDIDLVYAKSSLRCAEWTIVSNQDTSSVCTSENDGIALSILRSRGFNEDDIARFLNPSLRESMPDPFHLIDMKAATERLNTAICNNEKVVIIADYDVDGATSGALIAGYLRRLGVDADVYVPDRSEGYGPNVNIIRHLHNNLNADLCITVDCGIVAYEPLELAKSIGLDVIVIDHHIGNATLPHAVAVVNPNRHDEKSEFGYMAAVGVTFLVIVATNRLLSDTGFFKKIKKPDILEYLDIVALGTVCDMVPLTGFNRTLVSQGLKILNSSYCNLGITALLEVLDISGSKVNAGTLGFKIGPCINAGGRIGNSSYGAKLLMTLDKLEADDLAFKLKDLNLERQVYESEAVENAYCEYGQTTENFIVAVGCWHIGIIGLIAGRLKERVNVPTAVITCMNDGSCKASMRSVKGVNIGELVHKAKSNDIIIEGGGHKMAAGFSIKQEKIDDFINFMKQNIPDTLPKHILEIYDKISTLQVSEDFSTMIATLEPFGIGNPEPRFVIENASIISATRIGKDSVKFTISDCFGKAPCIAFKCFNTALGDAIMSRLTLSLAGKVNISRFTGKANFVVEDAVVSDKQDAY